MSNKNKSIYVPLKKKTVVCRHLYQIGPVVFNYASKLSRPFSKRKTRIIPSDIFVPANRE